MKCTALIVTFNRLEKLKKSMRETVEAGFSSIVIVNNGSSDGTREWLSSLSEPGTLYLILIIILAVLADLKSVVNIYAHIVMPIGYFSMMMMLIRKLIF